jgi:GWxTD domain-containing protein
MIRKTFFTLALLFGLGPVFAFEVSLTTAVFRTDDSYYLEIYSKFKLSEIQWAALPDTPDKLFARIELLCIIKQDGNPILAEKYHINSPEDSGPMDFWDMKRFGVSQGNYELELQYLDLNNISDTLTISKRITVAGEETCLRFSDILLLSNVKSESSDLPFTKSSFSYEPLEFDLVDPETGNLIFYTELYGLAEDYDDVMLIKYFIENKKATGLDKYSRTGYKKIHSDSTQFLLIDFPMADFASGNYILHLELNKKSREVICSASRSFSVYNPLTDYRNSMGTDVSFESSFFQFMTRDELNYSLKAIFPRVGNNMTEILNYIVASDELKPKRYFLYNFWSGFSLEKMQQVYEEYMDVARAVDNSYATNVGFGFESHRGYYFLKYGKPDDIVFEEDEPTAPPYEIWIYNYLEETQQTNVKFLFYNPSLAHNDFVLLHSTCRGERNNPRWELDLYSDAYNEQPSNYIDGRTMPSNFHRNAKRYFTDF